METADLEVVMVPTSKNQLLCHLNTDHASDSSLDNEPISPATPGSFCGVAEDALGRDEDYPRSSCH